jgi:predicted N-acetyltransferase YhbS
MIYVGRARSADEVARCIDLAASVFQPNAGQSAVERKRLVTVDVPGVTPDDFIVVSRGDDVVGTAVLVDRTLGGPVQLPVTYLTSVCIDPSERGAGLSRDLMGAVRDEATRRNSAMMLLNARRAVDGYYTKFAFWGLSSYNRLQVTLSATESHMSVRPVQPADLAACADAHERCHAGVLGYHLRDQPIWAYILRRMASLNISFLLAEQDGVRGYLIGSGRRIFEIGITGATEATAVLCAYCEHAGTWTLDIDLSPQHAAFEELSRQALVISRECPHGGHMGSVAHLRTLLASVERRAARHSEATGRSETVDGVAYDWEGSEPSVRITGNPVDYWTTARLFGATLLSTRNHCSRIDPGRPFIMPFADQV